jgi:hypothetical protein
MYPGNSRFDKADSRCFFQESRRGQPEPAIILRRESTEMTTKQAAPSAAKPNDILTPKEPTATGKALSQTIASAVPRVKISNNELSFDHPDRKVGEQRMMQALGTTDSDFMYGILSARLIMISFDFKLLRVAA